MQSAEIGLAKIALIWDIELTWFSLDLQTVFCGTMTIDISASQQREISYECQ
jgi:hypothetical protein